MREHFKRPMRSTIQSRTFVGILVVCWLSCGHGFSLLTTTTSSSSLTAHSRPKCCQQLLKLAPLSMATLSIRSPTQDEAEAMGIREWPQQAKQQGLFEESCFDDKSLVRYVLDGSGRVTVSSLNDSDAPEQSGTVKPGSLVEVTGAARLTWLVDSNEMILLTPGFEQMGIFAGVVVGLIAIIAGSLALS